MRAAVVIPARYASTRFPGKVLAPLLGRPLLAWAVEAALQAQSVDAVWVATDDPRIAEAAEQAGARVAMTSPACPSGTDRIAEAAQTTVRAEVYVNLQADEPLASPGDLDRLADVFRGDAQPRLATLATPLADARDLHDPEVVKVVCDASDNALYFSRAPIPYPRVVDRREGEDRLGGGWLRHIGIYGFSREALMGFPRLPRGRLEVMENLEQLRALEAGWTIRVLRTEAVGVGVDKPEDLVLAAARLQARQGVAAAQK